MNGAEETGQKLGGHLSAADIFSGRQVSATTTSGPCASIDVRRTIVRGGKLPLRDYV